MNPVTQSPAIEVPPDVHAFAAERGLTQYLTAVLELTRQVFPQAPVLVSVYQDHELPDERCIAIDVGLPANGSDTRALRRRWNDGLFACCPAPLVHNFVLGFDRVGE